MLTDDDQRQKNSKEQQTVTAPPSTGSVSTVTSDKPCYTGQNDSSLQ